MTSLNSAQIASIRTAQSLGGTTALDFFSKTTMVLNAVDYKWQALKVVLYDGTTVLGQVDILIPTIQANPNRLEFAPTFSIWTTIEECLNPPVVYEEGKGWFTTAPFSEPEMFDFPEGIGKVEVVNVQHEEVLLVPRGI